MSIPQGGCEDDADVMTAKRQFSKILYTISFSILLRRGESNENENEIKEGESRSTR